MLQPVGVDEFDERVYRLLLRQPNTPESALATALDADGDRVRRALDRLADRAMVHRSSAHGWKPTPPDSAIGDLIHDREAELSQLRAHMAELLDEFRAGSLANQPEDLFEVVVGREAIRRRVAETWRIARDELMTFDKPPYVTTRDADERAAERPLLARDVRVRALYSRDALTDSPWPNRVQRIQQLAREGEQARMLPELPIKLVICDRRLALLPLIGDERAADSMVLVSESGLIDALVALFEVHWAMGNPIGAAGTSPPTALTSSEHVVLGMLADGLTDEAIARQLDVSPRTVRRRVLGILDALRVSTRFQAGSVAARKGWI